MAIAVPADPIEEKPKTIEVTHVVGELKPDEKGVPRKVLAITIVDGETRYKLDENHTLVFIGADALEATFECAYCRRSVAFALPKLGEPAAVSDGAGGWLPPDDADKYFDRCTVEG